MTLRKKARMSNPTFVGDKEASMTRIGTCRGRPFPSPFANPPGKGMSSPLVNVLWGAVNVAVAYALLCHVGEFDIRRIADAAACGVGGFLTAIMMAQSFGRLKHY